MSDRKLVMLSFSAWLNTILATLVRLILHLFSFLDELSLHRLTTAISRLRLLWLTYEARKNPEKRIDEVLEEQEWQVLYLATQKNKALPTQSPKLREGVRQIASLGGFLGRKGDGEPGVKTLWRGWQRLQDLVVGWQLMMEK